MTGAQPGVIVVYRERDNVLFARVVVAHDDSVTVTRWLESSNRWAHQISRQPLVNIFAILPEDASPELLARQILAFRNMRNAERRRLNGLFEKRVSKFLKRRSI